MVVSAKPNVPICFHPGSFKTIEFAAHEYFQGKLAATLEALSRPASLVFVVANLLLSRILLRFPKLKVVFAESSLGSGTYLLEYGDHQAEQDRLHLATSTWPSTRDYLARSLGDLPEDARRRILFENAAKLYSVEI